MQVGEVCYPKEIWGAIKSRNRGADSVREARLQTLINEFECLRMNDSDSIDIFSGNLSELASKAASLGQSFEELKIVKKFLNGRPQNKYIQIIASLEQVLDLNTARFEDIVGRLKAYEERIQDDGSYEQQGNLLFSNSESSYDQSGSNNSRGRGKGWNRRRGRGNRRRGRGRSGSHERSKRRRTTLKSFVSIAKRKVTLLLFVPIRKTIKNSTKLKQRMLMFLSICLKCYFLTKGKSY